MCFRGIDVQKVNIVVGKVVVWIFCFFFGFKGMDKMFQGFDGDVIISLFFIFLILNLFLNV